MDPSEKQIIKDLENNIGKHVHYQVENAHITILDLRSKNLTILPESIGKLTYLQYLNLENNQLTRLPENFNNLRNLIELYLNSNALKELPDNFGKLSNLKKLNLSKNELQELPESFQQLTQLQALNLGENNFTKLPKSIDSLENPQDSKNLQQLFLYGNKMTLLPPLMNLKQLEYVGIDDAITLQLAEGCIVPKEISSMTSLSLTDTDTESSDTVDVTLLVDTGDTRKNIALLPTIQNLAVLLDNINDCRIRLKEQIYLKLMISKWIASEPKDLGEVLNKKLQTNLDTKKRSLLQQLKSTISYLSGVWSYIIFGALLIALLYAYLPGTTSILETSGLELIIFLYFIFQLYIGATLDRYALFFVQKTEMFRFVARYGFTGRMYIAFTEKLQSSMGILIGIIWVLSIKSLSQQSTTLGFINWVDNIHLVVVQELLHVSLTTLQTAFRIAPIAIIIPSLTPVINILFTDYTGVFFRVTGILTIFWAVFTGGWKTLLDPTQKEDEMLDKAKRNWYEWLALPIGIGVAILSITIDKSTFNGVPALFFQLGLAIGGILFLFRVTHLRYSMLLFLGTLLTIFLLDVNISIIITNHELTVFSILIAVLVTYTLIMPGIIPRRYRVYSRNWPLITLKPNIFTFMGQPLYHDGTRGKFWENLMNTCKIDPKIPGFFVLGLENSNFRDRIKKWDGNTVIFILEGYIFIPLLSVMVLVQLPVLFNVGLLLVIILLEIFYYKPLPKELKKISFKSKKAFWQRLLRFQTNIAYSEQKLIRLNLSENQLTSLPESFWQLTNLQELDLERNQLTFLPKNIEELKRLQYLNLKDNRLSSLPETFGQLTNLEYLDLRYNQLTSLPETFGQLSNLQRLELWGNKLTFLPKDIGELTNLQELNLNNNQLISLPETFGELINLQFLDLQKNQLTFLPENIGQLTNLLELYLNNNQLTFLPDNIGQLSNLPTLNLQSNQLISLPDNIGRLTRLHRLDLRYNKLTFLPENIGQLSNLQTLGLDGNQLTFLPENIGQLSNLQILPIDNNQLTSLPESFGELKQLRLLSLSGNEMTSISERTKRALRELKKHGCSIYPLPWVLRIVSQ